MMAIADELKDVECYFTTYYADGLLRYAAERGLLDFTILGGEFQKKSLSLLHQSRRLMDPRGESRHYDLVVTCSDLIIPRNIRGSAIVLVQEGMTDPENRLYHIVKNFRLPRYLASTSMTGLSDAYTVFCVASENYKSLFINKGVKSEKIVVTGIPNYDNCLMYCNNSFPYRNFVLAATSDTRETFRYENRKKFIRKVCNIADGRQIIFKLHPNEKFQRAYREIEKICPNAIIYHDGNAHEMIANCDVLITKFSTLVYTGIALGKEVYSDFPIHELRKLLPIQNGGTSASAISQVCERILNGFQAQDINQNEEFNHHTLLYSKV
ncbi:MAG: hypothetical protein IPK11_04570 [Ignavibacteria bacterium]|nr:hypothetical protein [Ignavibacteria bacterium]